MVLEGFFTMKENTASPACGPERKFHAVADLFPLLEGEAFEELVADIRKNGQREPILVDGEGTIIDGRNRYRACKAAGVEPRYEEWNGEGSLEEASLGLNLQRRHLNESQRALVAARLALRMETEAVKRRSRNYRPVPANLQGQELGESRVKAAARINVSARLTSYGIKLLRGNCEELVAAVGARRLKISTAAALAGLPREEQRRIVEAGPKEAARRARELRGEAAPEAGRQASPGSFGVMACGVRGGAEPGAPAGGEAVTLLWVATKGLGQAVEALKGKGFRYAGG
jgi:ParB-like chromosome segregation protein Spo0J